MDKQQKVLNKIKHTLNSGLTTPLGTKPNDECYTSMKDILDELSKWGTLGKFKGKRIVCPCDWDISNDSDVYQINIEYDCNKNVKTSSISDNIKSIVYKKFDLSKLLNDEVIETVHSISVKPEEVDEFLRNKLTCNFVRTLTQNAKEWGIKSITASGFNPDTNEGIKFQDVDYSKYDICITNPPFSLYGEFMKCIVGKIDFICLAPFLNRVSPNVGLPLMLKQAYLGFNVYIGLNFYNPTNKNEYKTKSVACDWITSFNEAQLERNKEFENHKSGISIHDYANEYIEYPLVTMKDGSHPIRVPATQIPDDYYGWMFTSINVLHLISFDDYIWYISNAKGYYNKLNPDDNPFMHKATNDMWMINGKKTFHGILLKRIIK